MSTSSILQRLDFNPFQESDLAYHGAPWRSIYGCWKVDGGHLVHELPSTLMDDSGVTANVPEIGSFSRWGVAKLVFPGEGLRSVRLSAQLRIVLRDGFCVALDDDAIEWAPYFKMRTVISDLASGSRGHEYHETCWPEDEGWHHLEIEGDEKTLVYRLDGKELFRLARPESRAFRQVTLESFAGLQVRSLEVTGEPAAITAPFLPACPEPEQKSPLEITALVDFADDLHFARYDLNMLDAMMQRLRALGVSRVYWLHSLRLRPEAWGPNADPALKARVKEWDHRIGNRPDGALSGGPSVEACYPFLKNAVEAAHRHGMECFGVMKPFDIPVTTRMGPGSPFALEHFYRSHPEAMLQRAPSHCSGEGAVRSIRLYHHNARPHGVRPEQITIWTSEDNQRYHRVTAPFTVSTGIFKRRVTDHWTGESREEEVATISVEGLNLESAYFAVVVQGERAGTFANRMGLLAEALDAEGRVVETRRNLPEHPRAGSCDWDGGRGFVFDGFTTPRQQTGNWRGRDWVELFQHLDGADLGIAFQRGAASYIPGAPDPLHPVTQAFWLEWVDEMLAAGVDGVDLRVMNHINIPDWANYGFSTLTQQAYLDRYGEPLEPTLRCRERHSALVGEVYTAFLRTVAERVRAAGGVMQHHISRPMEQRPGQRPMINIEWNWRQWLREGLLDAVTLKDHELGGAFYQEVCREARLHGAATYHCPYLGCLVNASHQWPEQLAGVLEWNRDLGTDGLILYEVATFLRGTEAGEVTLIRPEMERIL